MTASLLAALSDARRHGRRVAPPRDAITVREAYALQEAVFAERAVPVAGWKIGLTGKGIRKALGTDVPAAGRLADSDIMRSPARAVIGGGEYYVEGELIFVIGARLPYSGGAFSCEEVAGAVSALHVGIELVTSRFDTTDLPLDLLIADNCMADRVLVGNKVANTWEDRFSDMSMTLTSAGNQVTHGTTAAVMDSPLVALTWLANWLAGQGRALEPGQLVSSGTCTGVTAVTPGDKVSVDIAGLGGAAIEFIAE